MTQDGSLAPNSGGREFNSPRIGGGGDLKTRVRAAQIKAALSINRELVLLYWQIRCDILARQQAQSLLDKFRGGITPSF